MVRDLGGTIKAEGADLGVLMTFAEPARKMVEAAAAQWIADVGIESYPKLQLWTIGQYFAGVKPDLPQMVGFAKAPRHKPVERQVRLW